MEKKEGVIFGIMHETAAISCYQMKTGQQVRKSGHILFRNGFLGGSPDRYVGDRGLLEVKCLAKHKDRLIPQAILFEKENKTLKQFCLTENHKEHNYYYQIQGCLYSADKDWCEF